MHFIVYRARCKPTGKSYIGCTRKGLGRRRAEHEKCARDGVESRFYTALRQHGPSAFDWTILANYGSAMEMFAGERHFIALYHTQEAGYNTTSGGHHWHESAVDRYYIARRRLAPGTYGRR